MRPVETGGRAEARPAGVARVSADAASSRVPERVADAREEVLVALELHAPETLTEAVVDSIEPGVGCAGQGEVQPLHPVRQPAVADLEHEVEVVRHQRVRVHGPVVALGDGAEPIQEEAAKNVVEDRLPVVPAPDDVEVGTRLFVSRRPRHELKIAGLRCLVRQFHTSVSITWHRTWPTTDRCPFPSAHANSRRRSQPPPNASGHTRTAVRLVPGTGHAPGSQWPFGRSRAGAPPRAHLPAPARESREWAPWPTPL